MTTLTVNIDNKKTEKAVKAVFDSLGLDYQVSLSADEAKRPLNKAEQRLYNGLKKSFQEIKLHQEGKIVLRDARELFDEL